MDRMGEYAWRVDYVPAAEEGRVEGSIYRTFTSMGVLTRSSTDELELILWTATENRWAEASDKGTPCGVLCRDAYLAWS